MAAKLVTLRKEVFLLKNPDDQRKFYQETSQTDKLSSSFSEKRTFPHNANTFFKNLKSCIYNNFRKVRIKKGGKIPQLGERLIQDKLDIKTKLKLFLMVNKCIRGEARAKAELDEVEEFLIETCASKNAEKIKEHFSEMETLDGNFSQVSLWKLKKKIFPKANDPPMGKKNKEGTLITAPNLLKQLYVETYQKRLEHREIKDTLKDVFFLKEELWSTRMEILKETKSSPWIQSELELAVKSLKNNKTPDPNGMINEIFKAGCAGSDLQESLLILYNGMKESQFIPSFITLENITTIYKNKGSRFDMENGY